MIQSMSRLESGLLLLDYGHFGFTTFPRSFACLDSAFSVFSVSKSGLSLLLVADACSDSVAFSRSLGWLDSVTSAFGLAHADSFSSVRSMAKAGSVASALGISRMSLVFLPSVVDSVHLGSSPPVQSLSRTGSVMLVFNFAHLDFFPLARSFSRAGFVLSAFVFSHLALPLLLRNFACSESSVLLCGATCPETAMLALDCAHAGFSFLLRSPGHAEPPLSVLSSVHPASSMSLHQLG